MEQLPQLATPRALLIDRNSRDEFGPQEPNTPVELNGEDFKIVGRCDLGTGFSATGAALLESHNFARAFGGGALDEPTLGPLGQIDDIGGQGHVAGVDRPRVVAHAVSPQGSGPLGYRG